MDALGHQDLSRLFLMPLLAGGLYTVGSLIWNSTWNARNSLESLSPYIKLSLGSAVIVHILNIAAIAGQSGKVFLSFISTALILSCLIHLSIKVVSGKFENLSNLFGRGLHFTGIPVLLLIMGYLIIALGPPTDADSLDYHLGAAQVILATGTYPLDPGWFHGRLAGPGEALIALGMVQDDFSFGQLIQALSFSGVIFFIAALFKAGANNPMRTYVAAIASSPVFLQLVMTSKPLMLPIFLSVVAFSLAAMLTLRSDLVRERDQSATLGYIIVLTSAAINIKMSFAVSIGLVICLMLGSWALRHGSSKPRLLLFYAPFTFLLVVPLLVFRGVTYSPNLIESFHPFPGSWPGTAEFLSMITMYSDSRAPFPINLFLPTKPSELTTVIGLSVLVAFYLAIKSFRNLWRVIAMIITSILVTVSLLQSSSRFIIEHIIWLFALIAIAAPGLNIHALDRSKILRIAIHAQTLMVGLAILYFALHTVNTFRSNISRVHYLRDHAFQYSLIEWAKISTPPDSFIISNIRYSIFGAPNILAGDWMRYVSPLDIRSNVYKSRLTRRPDYILDVTSDRLSLPTHPCAAEPYAGPFPFREGTRNPFNSTIKYGWIMNIAKDCF